ncbi:MAG: N-formylglutamate amidohydrolase [Candidatus Devosia phytovorans]|uniref:N-formylglutamate amidohydrolase n=1 Tax=Candidatus Devosia phytovorans TaxID=3121372 RepID=A0AAJ5VU42_9HYPH|nr:N-formylglutamate amidohydrolase [Devosia sp.]WEK03513.1 MAG: N-formylglutamate amidohydrolase [Devosia sp.]
MNISNQNAVLVSNARGSSPFVMVCDHASNRIPSQYDGLGLTPVERLSHIAWDPGALSVSRALCEMLDAPLVQSTVSRIVIDCNRDLDAPDLIWTLSEKTRIAANENLGTDERQYRIDHFHRPYHASIETLLEARRHAGRETILVCMHSFTPVYHGVARPWPIGLIHGVDTGYTSALYDALKADDPSLNVGWNEPYAALNGVTLTLEKHGDGRGLDATMVEIRHDEILEPAGVLSWASRLAHCLETARVARKGAVAV